MKRRFLEGNPMLRLATLSAQHNKVLAHKQVMTVSSTLKKSLSAFLVMLCTVAFIWKSDMVARISPASLHLIAVGCAIMIAGLAMWVQANPLRAEQAILPYAILKGILLGLLSRWVEMYFPGLAFQAFLGTFIVFMIVAFISVNNIIQVTDSMRSRIAVILSALLILYIISFVLRLFGVYDPFKALIHGTGWVGIFFSIGVIVLASFCLLVDMDMIKQGAKKKLSKAIEWYCAMALLATVLWIYIEILHLLLKLTSRRRR